MDSVANQNWLRSCESYFTTKNFDEALDEAMDGAEQLVEQSGKLVNAFDLVYFPVRSHPCTEMLPPNASLQAVARIVCQHEYMTGEKFVAAFMAAFEIDPISKKEVFRVSGRTVDGRTNGALYDFSISKKGNVSLKLPIEIPCIGEDAWVENKHLVMLMDAYCSLKCNQPQLIMIHSK